MFHRPDGPFLRPTLGALLLVGATALAPSAASTQERTPPPTDPSEALKRAREQQAAFERFRQSRIPVEREREGGGCDARIGRICIWFGGSEEEDFPAEPTETARGRRGLIGVLLETDEVVDDPWVTGQLVHYLVEERDFRYAEQIATQCELDATWWCDALLGYSLHVRGRFVEAEAAFRDALSGMPPEERQAWLALEPVLTEDAEDGLDELPPRERYQAWELFWRLSDPLYLVPGNDRFTDHFARLVEVRNQEDAANPQGLEWDEDLAETLLRYGRIQGYSRTHNPSRPGVGGGFQIQDTRRVVGHHDPRSRGYLFPERFLASPSEVPPESWITAPREARSWYAPPYAPDFRGLESQVGRFRRTAEMLVVGAYRPAPQRADSTGSTAYGDPVDPFDQAPENVQAGLFLVPTDGGETIQVSGTDPEGVFTLRAEPGRYVSSLEVFEDVRRRAWRARQGVRQDPLLPGLVSVSDLLILDEGAPTPETLEEAIPHVRPGIRVGMRERFSVVWEVYGLEVREPVRVTVGFTEGRPGFLERVGEFLGVLEPEDPVEITFEDVGPDQVETVFRSMVLELPEGMEPGEYTLHLRLELGEGDPVVASRPIVVER